MGKKFVSGSQLAEALGITVQRIAQLVEAGIIKKKGRNQYPLVECREAYRSYKAAAVEAGDESTYLQYLKTSNDLMEMQNRVKRGELIHRDDFISATGARVQACRARLLIVPTRAAPLLIGNDDKGALSILKRMTGEARRELETPIDFKRIALDAVKNKKR